MDNQIIQIYIQGAKLGKNPKNNLKIAIFVRTEGSVGSALTAAIRDGIVKREDVYIITKVSGMVTSGEEVKCTKFVRCVNSRIDCLRCQSSLFTRDCIF